MKRISIGLFITVLLALSIPLEVLARRCGGREEPEPPDACHVWKCNGAEWELNEKRPLPSSCSDAPPGAFSLLSPAKGALDVTEAESPITLNWTESSGARSYHVELTIVGQSTPVIVDVVSKTSFILSGKLKPSTNYLWKIRARNSVGFTEATNGAFTFMTAGPPTARLNWYRPDRFRLEPGIKKPDGEFPVILDACESTPGFSHIKDYEFKIALPNKSVMQKECRYLINAPLGAEFEASIRVRGSEGLLSEFASASVKIKDILIIAFGDSYAAGEGASNGPGVPLPVNPSPGIPLPGIPLPGTPSFDFDPLGSPLPEPSVIGEPRWEESNCHRSRWAPASIVARDMVGEINKKVSVTFMSETCSGATINVLLSKQLPNMRQRLQGAHRHVDIIVVGIGGADMGFKDVIVECLRAVHPKCDASEKIMRLIGMRESELPTRLDNLIHEIRNLGDFIDSSTKIVLTEYPDVTRGDKGDYCFLMGDFTQQFNIFHTAEITPLESKHISSEWATALNRTLLFSAAKNQVSFAGGIWDNAITHGYCSTRPWVNTYKRSLGKLGCNGDWQAQIFGTTYCISDGTLHPNVWGAMNIASSIQKILLSPNEAVFDTIAGSPICGSIGNLCVAKSEVIHSDPTSSGSAISNLSVSTIDSSHLAPGKDAVIAITVDRVSPGDEIKIHFTGRALQGINNSPSYKLLQKIPIVEGTNTYTARYTLPAGVLHGILAYIVGNAGARDQARLLFMTAGEDSCPAVNLLCNNSCSRNDINNCGACGNVCPDPGGGDNEVGGTACSFQHCQPFCRRGWVLVSGRCIRGGPPVP